jgi:hypothetical protein
VNRDHTTIRAPLEETGAQIAVRIKAHALGRFVERVSPGLDAIHATAVLTELAAFASITAKPPDWLSHRSRAPMYLALGDVAFLLVPDPAAPDLLVAVTCLVSGGASDHDRRRRRRRRQAHRRSRRFDRRTERRIAGQRRVLAVVSERAAFATARSYVDLTPNARRRARPAFGRSRSGGSESARRYVGIALCESAPRWDGSASVAEPEAPLPTTSERFAAHELASRPPARHRNARSDGAVRVVLISGSRP